MPQTNQRSFVLYGSWREAFAHLSAEQTKAMLDAIFAFECEGITPEFAEPALAIMWDFIGDHLVRDAAKYAEVRKKRSESGKRGNQKRWKEAAVSAERTAEGKPSQTVANIAVYDDVNVNEHDDVDVNVHEHVDDNANGNVNADTDAAAAPPAASQRETWATTTTTAPPSVEMVEQYCREQGYTLDAQHFVDYYAATGWMVGTHPMRDWRAVLRNWARNEYPKSTQTCGNHAEGRNPSGGYARQAPAFDPSEHSYNLADFEALMNQF